jgi:sec-independent protein translocase protein TatA
MTGIPLAVAIFGGRVGWGEVVLILGVLLLLFGARKLPEIARAIGKSLKEFKKATKDVKKELTADDDTDDDNPPYPPESRASQKENHDEDSSRN